MPSRAASSTRIAVSATCSAPPSTSPVWPPICRCASHAMPRPLKPASSGREQRVAPRQRQQRDHQRKHDGDRRRRRIGLAGIAGQPVVARIRQVHRHPRQHAARQRVRGDQAWHDIAIRNRRQRGKFRGKTHQQDQRAVGAEPAVAHDLQLGLAVAAAAETVGDVGEAVLVQRAGQDRAGAERQRRRGQIRHADVRRPRQIKSHHRADQRADHRKHPVRAHEIFRHRPLRMRHRQPRQERDRGFEIVEPFIHGAA